MRFSVRDRSINPDDPDDVERYRAAMHRSRVPWRFWDARIDLVKGNNAWLTEWCGDPGRTATEGTGLYVHGDLNTGKSAVAAILAREFVLRNHIVVWLAVAEIPFIMFNATDEHTKIRKRLQSADMLVLDDLGSESFKLSGAGGVALEQIIRGIYHRQRSLVVTSNNAWEQVPVVFGSHPALASLIQRALRPVKLSAHWPTQ